MFSTNTNFQSRFDGSTLFDRHFNELANSFDIQSYKRIVQQDALFHVLWQEGADIISRVPKGHLRQIVGTKGKEVGLLCDLVGDKSGTRNLNHGSNLVIASLASLLKDLSSHLTNQGSLMTELFYFSDKGDHYIGSGVNASVNSIQGSLENGSGLHFNNFRSGNPKTASSQTQHGINLFGSFHLFFELVDRGSQFLGQCC
mmetsp:Transcript_24980/g.45231  ORF Transcript_24980/g.45231 Transcript_24980/m.45231 type:complete len:200 (+) Transcript_24980:239-838(+)